MHLKSRIWVYLEYLLCVNNFKCANQNTWLWKCIINVCIPPFKKKPKTWHFAWRGCYHFYQLNRCIQKKTCYWKKYFGFQIFMTLQCWSAFWHYVMFWKQSSVRLRFHPHSWREIGSLQSQKKTYSSLANVWDWDWGLPSKKGNNTKYTS